MGKVAKNLFYAKFHQFKCVPLYIAKLPGAISSAEKDKIKNSFRESASAKIVFVSICRIQLGKINKNSKSALTMKIVSMCCCRRLFKLFLVFSFFAHRQSSRHLTKFYFDREDFFINQSRSFKPLLGTRLKATKDHL